MKTFAQTIELESEDAIEAYDALHARAWPEILESLRAVGVVDMFIYRSGVRLFMHMTTVDAFDPDVDFARHMAMSERCVEWGEVTRGEGWRVVDALPPRLRFALAARRAGRVEVAMNVT